MEALDHRHQVLLLLLARLVEVVLEVLEQLLPKTFFAEPAPEETSRKSAGGPGWWAQLGLRVSNSGVVQGIGMVLAVPFPE